MAAPSLLKEVQAFRKVLGTKDRRKIVLLALETREQRIEDGDLGMSNPFEDVELPQMISDLRELK